MRVSASGGRDLTMQSTFLPTVRITRSITWHYLTFLRCLSAPPDLSPGFTLETVADRADASLRTSLCWRRTARLALNQRTRIAAYHQIISVAQHLRGVGLRTIYLSTLLELESASQQLAALYTYEQAYQVLRRPRQHARSGEVGNDHKQKPFLG